MKVLGVYIGWICGIAFGGIVVGYFLEMDHTVVTMITISTAITALGGAGVMHLFYTVEMDKEKVK